MAFSMPSAFRAESRAARVATSRAASDSATRASSRGLAFFKPFSVSLSVSASAFFAASVWRKRLPEFAAAYRQARRASVEAAVGRMQAATGHAVDALVSVARTAERDGDRVRAATALLDYAYRGLT